KHSKAEFKTLDLDVETQPEEPVYWSAELTKVKDDIVFIEVDGKPFFAIGFDTHKRGPWDGVTGPNGCYKDENGVIHGQLDNAAEMTQQAVEAGANFAFQWSYTEEISSTEPRIYGRWTDGWGISMPKENDFIPIMVNGFGESDMDGKPKEKIEQMKKEFEDFKNRTGNWSPEKKPNLPPYEEIPWFAWHPTWRMRGGGDGTGELLTDELAETFAKTTNMMIGDNYTYVCNKHDSFLNPVTGQCGEKDECYDDWLAKDDECHQSYFSAAWSLAHSIRQKSNPDAVIWMWLQGHAFDDDIGISECWNGYSTLWAKGPFPAMRYLRKEITSTIAAGGTGIIFFGYLYNRENTAEKLRSLMRTLAHPEVYEPALTSPRLDLGFDLTDIGEGGRVHVISKWHDATKTAYIIGANPGAYVTEFTIEFPWTISKAELLDWFAPKFTASGKLGVNGRKP
ncbi:MAG: hypothetical protein FJ088_13680, partial [Deltaproteobacteria bacterium]|nr:hypothetical protein [Deltaproteobacteria bacterium]